jgi:hypothetical protein
MLGAVFILFLMLLDIMLLVFLGLFVLTKTLIFTTILMGITIIGVGEFLCWKIRRSSVGYNKKIHRKTNA